MKLLAVRHAAAEDLSPTGQDKDRSLSLQGCEQFKQVCQNLNHLNWTFDLLLDSPLLRSQQTADIFCEHFSVKKRERSQNLKPLAPAEELLSEIEVYNPNSIVIFGHQPFLTRFISYCLLEEKRNFITVQRSGMALLEFPLSVKAGSACINFLLTWELFKK